MRFLNGAFTLAAFSALVAHVLGAPVETGKLAHYGDENDPARHAVDLGGLKAHVGHSSIPVYAKDDGKNLVRESIKPPTEEDFRAYLVKLIKEPGYVNYNQHLVFWSGVSEMDAQNFAIKHKRFTLGMLIQRQTEWEIYQKPRSEGGYWEDWAEVFEMFWDPISKVLADIARSNVYAYFTEGRAEEQKDLSRCLAVWCRMEKRPLVQALHSPTPPRVNSIEKFILYGNGTTKSAGFIRKLTD